MKLIDLQTKNFRLHADTSVTFPDEGVLGIIGTNESGKSTVLEAVQWALFGGDVTRGTKETIRWHGAPDRHTASVTLRFAVAGVTYRIERGENTARIVNETDGSTVADGTSPVNAKAPELIGMSPAEFQSSYLCEQKALSRIQNMLPTERQAFVREVMGVGKIDEGLKSCRKKKAALAEERRGLEAGLGEREPLVEQHAEAHEASVASVEKRERVAAILEKVATEHEAARETFEKAEADRERNRKYVRQKGDAENTVAQATAEIEKLTVRRESQDAAKERLQGAEEELAALPELQSERDELVEASGRVGRIESLDARLAQLGTRAKEILDEINATEVPSVTDEEVEEANREAGQADAALEHVRTRRTNALAEVKAEASRLTKEVQASTEKIGRIKSIGSDGECPTCTRVMGENFDLVLEGLTSHLDSIERENRAVNDRMVGLSEPADDELEMEAARDAAEEDLERLLAEQKERDRIQAALDQKRTRYEELTDEIGEASRERDEIGSVAFDPDRLAEVKAEIARLGEIEHAAATDRVLVSQIEETEKSIAEWGQRRSDAGAAIAGADLGLADIDYDETAHGIAKGALVLAVENLSSARVKAARAEEAERGANQRLEATDAALASYDRRAEGLEEVKADHLLHERTDAALSQFRTSVISTIRPEMEALMSGFIQILTDGRHESVELTEDFSPVLYEDGVASEVISGGTEDVTALAMRLAISQMIAERAGHPLELLILDEPFGSLDETRRGNVLTLIRELRSVFRQVVVISHVAETRDAVDHVVELEFDAVAGMTRVVTSPDAVRVVA